MEQTRRSILGVLGLSAAVVSTEAVAFDEDVNGKAMPLGCPAYTQHSYETQDKIATALENLVKSIRNREALATKLSTKSDTKLDDFLEHKVTVTVELPAQPLDVRISEEGRISEEAYRKAQQVLEDARAEAKLLKADAHAEAKQIINKAHSDMNAERLRRLSFESVQGPSLKFSDKI